jgi:hypothetical protein
LLVLRRPMQDEERILKAIADMREPMLRAHPDRLGGSMDPLECLLNVKEFYEEMLATLRYISRDEAALETDCAHDQCDTYVMKAKETLHGKRRISAESTE